MALKRSRGDGMMSSLDMAKCLVLLSHDIENKSRSDPRSETFECKTCNRTFSSFQALGGHRASHKRPKLMGDKTIEDPTKVLSLGIISKPKMHECTICGLEFGLGQALGGHMRKHKASSMAETIRNSSIPMGIPISVPKFPVLRRSGSCKSRSYGLDLNLTPLENDLQFLFGKMAPNVFI